MVQQDFHLVGTIGSPESEELHAVLFRVLPVLILSYRRRIFDRDLHFISLYISRRGKQVGRLLIEEGNDGIDAQTASGELLRLLLRGAGVRDKVS